MGVGSRQAIRWLLQAALAIGLTLAGIADTSQAGSRRFLLATLVLALLYQFRGLKTKISRSSLATLLALLFFLGYYFAHILFEYSELNVLVQSLIGSTGGILLFLVYGVLANEFVSTEAESIESALHSRRAQHLCFMMFGCELVVIFMVFRQLASDIALERFALDTARDDYQKISDYLIIAYLLISNAFIVVSSTAVRAELGRQRAKHVVLLLMYVCIGLSVMLLSQLFGSNGGLGFTALVLIVTVYSSETRMRLLKSPFVDPKSGLRRILLKSSPLKEPRFWVIAVILAGLAAQVFQLATNEGVRALRITNFGAESSAIPRSIESRIEVLQYYPDQLAFAPLLGSLRVDQLTAGDGRYAHSLLLSLQSHLGLVGLVLFAIYLREVLKKPWHAKLGVLNANMYSLEMYRRAMLILGIMYACFATFFTWAPLWYLFGTMQFRRKQIL
jgi:hypothetical protein